MKPLNVRQQAIAFEIWRFAEPLGWNVTFGDVANALGISHQEIAIIARRKDWTNRFRTTKPDHAGTMRFPALLGGNNEF